MSKRTKKSIVEKRKKEERDLLLQKEWIEKDDCKKCEKPILTAKGEMAAEQWAEANMAIDHGEFSDPYCHYEEFCTCEEDGKEDFIHTEFSKTTSKAKAKTKFEVTMNIEVADDKDVNGTDVPVEGEVIADKISKAIENIYFVEPVDIRNISVSRTGRTRTNITPKVIKNICCVCGGTYELSEEGGQIVCANCK